MKSENQPLDSGFQAATKCVNTASCWEIKGNFVLVLQHGFVIPELEQFRSDGSISLENFRLHQPFRKDSLVLYTLSGHKVAEVPHDSILEIRDESGIVC